MLVALLAVVAGGCSDPVARVRDYQIVVNGSTTPVAMEFTGSYTCASGNAEITRDLSGKGSFTTSFQCLYLKRVRVQLVYGTGLVSLAIYEDGKAIFESAPTDATTPIIFANTRE